MRISYIEPDYTQASKDKRVETTPTQLLRISILESRDGAHAKFILNLIAQAQISAAILTTTNNDDVSFEQSFKNALNNLGIRMM
jgi:hypothetical protein